MTVGYLQLLENRNRHSRERADGGHYWGYPTRNAQVQVLGIHTAEIDPGPGSAEAIARYFTFSTRAASYHEIGDADRHIVLLPPGATAFGAVGWNSNGWHYSFATRAHLWGREPEWDTAALELGAARCRIAADLHGIPVRRITLAQAHSGMKGFIDHGRLDPGRRTDPGTKFPWTRFLALVAGNPDPTPPTLETFMGATPKQINDLIAHQKTAADAARLDTEAHVIDVIRHARSGLGLDPDPASDAIWGGRIVGGSHTFAQAIEALTDKAGDQVDA